VIQWMIHFFSVPGERSLVRSVLKETNGAWHNMFPKQWNLVNNLPGSSA